MTPSDRKAWSAFARTIQGWAFAPDSWLPGALERGKRAAEALPPKLKPEAVRVLETIRKRIK